MTRFKIGDVAKLNPGSHCKPNGVYRPDPFLILTSASYKTYSPGFVLPPAEHLTTYIASLGLYGPTSPYAYGIAADLMRKAYD